MAPTKKNKVVKKTKKSKTEREDCKSFYCPLSKSKTGIGKRYCGDRMGKLEKCFRIQTI